MATSQTIFYKVGNSRRRVTLTITVGEGQKGSTTVSVGEKTVKRSTTKGKIMVDLGIARSLRGKKCISTSVVTDINPNTNRTTVAWELTGGSSTVTKSTTETLDKNGDSILHAATIYLA